jgi:DNA polymerase-3 subunit delta'
MHKIYPWQQNQWRRLVTRQHNENLPHSLLLSGQKGLGKTSFALALAELLLCEQPDDQACGNCRSCSLLQANSHPDFKLIKPDDKIIKVEQIRDIVEMISKKPHQNKSQVIIIKPAHAMNVVASNALLKTLEEPNGSVIIMLITDKPSFLLATIRSRCQQVLFHPPTRDIAKNYLEQYVTETNKIDLLLALSDNAPLQALNLDQNNIVQQHEEIFKCFASLLRNKMNPIEFAKICLDIELPIILHYLQHCLYDMIKIKFNLHDKFLLNIDKIEILQSLASLISLKNLFRYSDQLAECYKYIDNNLNKCLMLENIAVNGLNYAS